MSSSAAAKFSCDSCGKQYTWKPELGGKKAKCKCGTVMVVPKELSATEPEPDLYDLLPQGDVDESATARVVAAPVAVAAPSKGNSAAPASPMLGYQRGPSARERERMSSSVLMEMKRDVYVPVALLIAGFALYVGFYAIKYQLSGAGIAATTAGVGIMMTIKAVLLIGFALMVAGPLGVSFGGIWTAALKLAAIAVFVDGATTVIDNLIGVGSFMGFSLISFPIALGLYWVLLIYLFSMDSGDSWFVVMLLCVFDQIVRTVILLVMLSMVMGWGGISIPAGGGAGGALTGGGGSNLSNASEVVQHVASLKERDALREAKKFIAEGRQDALRDIVNAFYSAGATNVWFEVDWNAEGKPEPQELIVELPKNTDKRAAVLALVNDYYKAIGQPDSAPEPGEDPSDGEPFLMLPLN